MHMSAAPREAEGAPETVGWPQASLPVGPDAEAKARAGHPWASTGVFLIVEKCSLLPFPCRG